MLKLDFTNAEIDKFKSKIKFTDRQLRIMDYRQLRYSIVKMADLEHCGTSTIDREIKEISKKIMKPCVVRGK